MPTPGGWLHKNKEVNSTRPNERVVLRVVLFGLAASSFRMTCAATSTGQNQKNSLKTLMSPMHFSPRKITARR